MNNPLDYRALFAQPRHDRRWLRWLAAGVLCGVVVYWLVVRDL